MVDAELTQLAADIDARCRLHGKFVLRSGQITDEYFDKYLFEADPRLLRRVAERMVPLIPADAQVLGGLELGGVPITTMLSQLTGLRALYVRKQAKEYGTSSRPGARCSRPRRLSAISGRASAWSSVRSTGPRRAAACLPITASACDQC